MRVPDNSPTFYGALLRKNVDTSSKTVHLNCFSDSCRLHSTFPKGHRDCQRYSQLLASAQAVLGCNTLPCQLCWDQEGLAMAHDFCIQHMMLMMITFLHLMITQDC